MLWKPSCLLRVNPGGLIPDNMLFITGDTAFQSNPRECLSLLYVMWRVYSPTQITGNSMDTSWPLDLVSAFLLPFSSLLVFQHSDPWTASLWSRAWERVWLFWGANTLASRICFNALTWEAVKGTGVDDRIDKILCRPLKNSVWRVRLGNSDRQMNKVKQICLETKRAQRRV